MKFDFMATHQVLGFILAALSYNHILTTASGKFTHGNRVLIGVYYMLHECCWGKGCSCDEQNIVLYIKSVRVCFLPETNGRAYIITFPWSIKRNVKNKEKEKNKILQQNCK